MVSLAVFAHAERLALFSGLDHVGSWRALGDIIFAVSMFG